MRLTTDEFNFVNLLTPKDRNGTATTTIGLNFGLYESGIIFLALGNCASTLALTVEMCKTAAGGTNTTIPFTYRLASALTEDTVASDTWGDRTAVTAAAQPLACGGMDYQLMAIEVKAEDLTDTYPYFRLNFTPGSGASLCAAWAVLKPRFVQKTMVTAIT
jgi:hypothetical protein